MKPVILEPFASGHRLHFVRLVIEAFLEIGCRPTLATHPSTTQTPESQIHLGDLVGKFDILELKPLQKTGRLERIKFFAKCLGELSQAESWDKLLIPTASQFSESLIYANLTRAFHCGKISTEALFLGPGYGYANRRLPQRLLHQVQLKLEANLGLDVYSHLDPFQLVKVSQSSRMSKTRFRTMPDPAPPVVTHDIEIARKELGLPVDGRIGLIAGGISEQKGVFSLLDGFARSQDRLNSDDRILLAGAFSTNARNRCESDYPQLLRSNRLLMLDHYLTERDLNLAFTASNFVCAVQTGRPGSSGNVVRAIASHRPVLGRTGDWAERVINQFKMGWVTDTTDADRFASDLGVAFEESKSFKPTASAIRFGDFLSEANFKAHWSRETRLQMGMAPDPHFFPWHECINNGAQEVE